MNLIFACMSQRWFPAGALLVALVLLGVNKAVPRLPSSNPDAAPRVAPIGTDPSLPDTLRAATTTGTPLIRSLPAELNDRSVSRYVVVEGPSLSGVAGRSFTWIPEGAAPGTYDVHLRAQHPDAQPDTLVLRIELNS